MTERLDIERKKFISKFKKDARIKECFHYEQESCSDAIISAHSIQRGAILTLLEELVDGNLSIYSFLYIKYDSNGIPLGFEPLGKKEASIFFGFCGHHDTEIFKSIENNQVNLDNDNIVFCCHIEHLQKIIMLSKNQSKGLKLMTYIKTKYLKL